MYALVQNVEVVRKRRLDDVFYVIEGPIVADSAFQSHALPVRAI